MIVWLILAIYVLGWLVTARFIAGAIAYDYHATPQGEDVIFGITVGGLVAFAWLIVLPFYLAWEYKRSAFGVLLRMPPQQRIRQLENERYEHEDRIRELERELGIGKDS